MPIATRVISQTNKMYEGEALVISVPSVDGTLTIYPNHMDLVALLDIGEVKIQEQNEEHKFLISGGLLQVKKNIATILSDEAILPKDIAIKEIAKAMENANKQLENQTDPAILIQLEKQLRFETFKRKFIEEK